MLCPQAAIKWQIPTLGTDSVSICSAVSQKVMGTAGIHWCIRIGVKSFPPFARISPTGVRAAIFFFISAFLPRHVQLTKRKKDHSYIDTCKGEVFHVVHVWKRTSSKGQPSFADCWGLQYVCISIGDSLFSAKGRECDETSKYTVPMKKSGRTMQEVIQLKSLLSRNFGAHFGLVRWMIAARLLVQRFYLLQVQGHPLENWPFNTNLCWFN